jgi:hypothetical protein
VYNWLILEDTQRGVKAQGEHSLAGTDAIVDNARRRGDHVGSRLSGHVIGLLKEYMRDLVEQAAQEAGTQQTFGFAPAPYRPDQALSDLLAILDDRIESEGVQVGLPEGFLHQMWTICNDAQAYIKDRVWLESNVGEPVNSKTRTRELTYRALIHYIEGKTE